MYILHLLDPLLENGLQNINELTSETNVFMISGSQDAF
jgi:hypothetical protein